MRGHLIGWILATSVLGVGDPLGVAGVVEAKDTEGYLYGRILATSGDSYEGLLRWGGEEAFWDDLFQSAKEELPALDHVPKRARKGHKGHFEVFGFKMEWDGDGALSRQFATRFGDIEKIEVTGDEDATVYMKSGSRYDVSGYANDVGNVVTVWDESLGKVDLRWRRIDTIEFLPTPSSVRPEGYRLRGRVETDAGEFSGFIQWDSQECLSTDILDGNSRDGEIDIEMGRIRSIEKRGNHSRVELEDGRTLELDGSNDVDSSIRGILVEDERYGRVEVRWSAFNKVVFEDEGGSGRGYGTYRGSGPLEATVFEAGGRELRGPIYFDLDESEGWEFLNGEFTDVEFNIPFETVAEIEPRGGNSSRVRLLSGENIRLSEGQDVSDRNDGVLVFVGGPKGDPEYVPWEDVERIEFHW